MTGGMVFKVVESAPGLASPALSMQLEKQEDRIKANEGDSLEARWEFGRVLLKQRKGKQLPKGLAAEITERFGIKRSEITRRMAFAETFSTRKEVDQARSTYGSWDRICREALPKKPRSAKKPAGARLLEFKRFRKLVLTLNRDEPDEAESAELDRIYDAMLVHFNRPKQESAK